MALSRKLSKQDDSKTPSVEALIMKGGSSGALEEEGEEVISEDLKRVQLRVPMSKLRQIDRMVKKRPGKLSRHTWIMEAIEEKLQREGESVDSI
ncbi:MAG: hypothetical protein H6573_34365 [Lewinellaceae bacterium]|nr:hypothetical protein [Lewinellaceae bacterium]